MSIGRSFAAFVLLSICVTGGTDAADLPLACSRGFIPVDGLICGESRCSGGQLIHLTGPSKDDHGKPLIHSTILAIGAARNRYVVGGYILNVGQLADKGYFNIKLSTLTIKGAIQIQSEAITIGQPPAHLRMCLFTSDRPLEPHRS